MDLHCEDFQDGEGNSVARRFNGEFYRLTTSDGTVPNVSGVEGVIPGDCSQGGRVIGQHACSQLEPVEPELQWDEINEGATVVVHHLHESSKIEVCFLL